MSTPGVKSSSDETSRVFAGVDVGGTNIKLGIVDDDGRTLLRHSIPTEEERGPTDAMRRVSDEIQRMLGETKRRREDLLAVGLASPGTMDIGAGILLQPHNLPHWWDFPIRDCLRQACGYPVSFANDANAAAFGEFWVGSGRAYPSIAFFTLGTGVGGGIIIGSLSIDGENSAGSELGHTIIDFTETGRMCGCGQRGHLEAYASAKAVVKRTEEALDAGTDSSLNRQRQEGPLTPLIVAQEAEAGDALARKIVMDTAMYLGIGAVNVMHTVDPGAVIFGGAMTFGGEQSELGQSFLDRIREEIVTRAFPVLAKRTQIRFATLGGDAGYIGAAGIARAAMKQPSAD
jgi:glucokinase